MDAAATVLANAQSPMTIKELIDAMASKGLWKSPEGKTPERTALFSDHARDHQEGQGGAVQEAGKGKFAVGGEG